LPATAGILQKRFWGTLKKIKKSKNPLFFSTKTMATRQVSSEILERIGEKKQKDACASPDVDFCLEMKSFRRF